MNPLRILWRLAFTAACLLALLALTNPSWGGDKEKGKTVNGKDKDNTKEMIAKPFDKITWDASELDKNFKVLKVEGTITSGKSYSIRWSLVARKKLAPQTLMALLNKLEVRFYADNIIVGRYPLQPVSPEQQQRGLVQDEKMVVQLQLAPNLVERLRGENPTKAALVKAD